MHVKIVEKREKEGKDVEVKREKVEEEDRSLPT